MYRLQTSLESGQEPTRSGEFFRYSSNSAVGAFHDFINDHDFPCVAAKSALATEGMRFFVAGDLRDRTTDRTILSELRSPHASSEKTVEFVSTVILFPQTPPLTEIAFEKHLWALLQSLHELDRDAFDWDHEVSSDPNAANFAMSIRGTAYFIVGMHPGSSRLARRAPMPAAALNPHAQFRRLKEDELFERLRQAIRERDIALQGDANPMLADHGEISEAAQYSGRQVPPGWVCPFRPRPVD